VTGDTVPEEKWNPAPAFICCNAALKFSHPVFLRGNTGARESSIVSLDPGGLLDCWPDQVPAKRRKMNILQPSRPYPGLLDRSQSP